MTTLEIILFAVCGAFMITVALASMSQNADSKLAKFLSFKRKRDMRPGHRRHHAIPRGFGSPYYPLLEKESDQNLPIHPIPNRRAAVAHTKAKT